jgi:TonB-linked SusC/RagA family outer membrane protein
MKLTFILLVVGLLRSQAEGYAQTVTFSGKNVGIEKVFRAIEDQTGYAVFANKDLLKNVRRVSVSARDMPLTDFLELALKDQPIGYQIENRTIFIKEKAAAPPAQAPGQATMSPPPPIQITGTVSNAEGSPLAGATIMIKKGRSSAVTDAEGRFTINALPDQVLVISFIGYQTVEEPVKGRTAIHIVLQKTLSELNQVVITALGIKKASKALTYNVQEVGGDEVNKVKDANFVNSLSGKVAGITINSASSGIGGSVRVVMRGAKSLFGNNNALYVVDGIQLPDLTSTQPNDVFQGAGATGDGISFINPDDIASISVLTGPAAAALYGSQAANGVVLITTRKGTPGKVRLNLSNSNSFYSPFVMPEFQNEYGSTPQSYFSWGNKLSKPSGYKPADFFQTGVNITNAFNFSTGSENNQTYLSGANVSAQGIIPNNKLNRYNFSIRNTSTFLDDRFNLDLGLMYIKDDEQNMLLQGQYFNPLIPVYLFPRGDDISKYQVFERYDGARNFKTQFWPFGDLGFQMQNPYWIINRDFFNNNKERYMASASLKYKLTDWMDIAGRVKLDNNGTVGEKKYMASTSGLFASPAGAYFNQNARTKQTYGDVLLNFNRSFGLYSITANVGASILDTRYSLTGFGGNLLSVPNLFSYTNVNMAQATPTQDGYHDQTQSVFASIQANYRNMVFLDATSRNDWSSALANTTSKSIFYPSIGLSAVLTDILHLRSDILSFAKVRGSYAEVGNAPQRYVSITTYPIIGGFPVTSSYLPATGLQPERTRSYEAGVNLRFWHNHINLDVTAYTSSTNNQLFNPVLAPSTGYSSFYINAGQVRNKGVEASLGYNGKVGPLDWNSTATFTLNRNKIIRLLSDYTDKTTGQLVSVDSLSVGGTGSYMMALTKGGSIGDIYVTTLATDEHGYINVGQVTQTVTADPNTYIKAGNYAPRYNIGFRNSFSYKNFNFSFLVSARVGGVCVSVTQAIMDRFGVSAASAKARDAGGVFVNGYKIPAEPFYTVAGGGVAGVGSLYTYSATNVRLGEAALSYTLPASIFHDRIQGITLSVTGRNLFMFYNKAPFDPESTANTGTYYQGIDYFIQPSLRNVGFGVKVQF